MIEYTGIKDDECTMVMEYIEDITWGREDTNFIFEFFATRK